MYRLKYSFKQIFDNLFFNILFVALNAFVIYNMIIIYRGYSDVSDELASRSVSGAFLIDVSAKCFFYVIAYLLWSTYLSYKHRNSNFDELAFGNYRFGNYYYLIAVNLVNLTLSLLYCIIIAIMSCSLDNMDMIFASYIIKRVLISFFLPANLMILVGFVIGRIRNNLLPILLIIMVAFVISPTFLTILQTVSSYNARIIACNFDVIQNNYYNASGFATDLVFGYMWAKIIGMICVFSIPVCHVFIYKYKRFVASVLFVIFAVCEIYYYLPDSRVFDLIFAFKEDAYYSDVEVIEENVDFCITDYCMDIEFGKTLKVSCDMKVSEKAKNEYTFTLYHTLKVKEVLVDGKNADFSQNADWFTVYTDDNSSNIKVKYEGIIDYYVANGKYIYLPEDFPYYPLAGVKNIGKDGFLGSAMNDFKSHYTIKLYNYDDIISNLTGIGAGKYEGNSKGIMLLRGPVYEKVKNGITFICPKYPYASRYCTDENLEMLADMLYELEDTYDYSFSDKKILAIGYVYLGYLGTGNHFGDEYVDLVSTECRTVKRTFEEKFLYVED